MVQLPPAAARLLSGLLGAKDSLEVRAALDALVEGGAATSVALYRLQDAPHLLVAVGPLREGAARTIPPGAVVCWRAVETGVAELEDDLAAYPLLVDGRAVGVLACEHLAEELVEVVPAWVATALHRSLVTDQVLWRARALDQVVPVLRDGLLMITADGQVLEYSPALERLVGWKREAVAAKGWTNLVYADAKQRAEVQQGIAALARGRPSEGTRRTLARSDGDTRRAAIWSRLVPSPTGDTPAFLAVFQDVTEVEDEHRRQLRDDALTQLGVLARGVAHDFNNLLCSVMGHADLIAISSDDEAVQRHASTLLTAAEHGSSLVRQLLAFGGSTNTVLRPQALDAVVRRACQIFRGQIPPGVVLSQVSPPHDLVVEIDEGQLQHAVLNLLTNAIHAVGSSGTLKVDAFAASIPEDATYRAPGLDLTRSWACLRVRDSGAGFPPGDLSRLFEPYFSTREGGHGVGLAAVRGVIGNHGGAVRLLNEGGAVVELYLPVADRPELALERLPSRSAEPVDALRVWVLDDQSQILEFSRIALMAEGHAVSTFTSVDEILVAVKEQPWPELVILDVIVPGGGGARALEAMRTRGLHPKVLWVSGQLPEQSPVGPGEPFLQKPYTGRELVRVVSELVRASAQTTG